MSPPETRGFFSFLDDLTFVEDDSSRYEIEVGDNGFSYLDMVSEKKARRITFEERQNRQTSAALDGSTRAHGKLNLKKVESVDHDALCLDTDFEAILRDIQERRNRTSLLPFAAVIVAGLLIFWLSLLKIATTPWLAMLLLAIPLFPGSFLFLWNVWKLDISRKHVRFAYRFSGSANAAFEAINQGLSRLTNSDQVLLFSGRRHFEDTRYSGGSQNLPTFDNVLLDRKKPPLFEIDFDVWHVRAFHKDIFFMPDHLLVYQGSRIGSFDYSHLKFSARTDVTQARDKAKRTADSKVVGQTYRFVNNDGSPDQRFNNNTEIPLIEYGILTIAGSGLELTFYASRQRTAITAPQSFAHIQQLAGKPVQKAAEARRREARSQNEGQTAVQAPDIHDVLMDAMCCVMVADGRASKSEKARIHEILKKLNIPWDSVHVDRKLADFVDRVRDKGYSNVLAETCGHSAIFKGTGSERTLLRCLDVVAAADGTVDAAERTVCDRIRSALT